MKTNYKVITAFIVLLSMLTLKMGALSGTVTINNSNAPSATNFVSFTSFAAALNSAGVSGPLTVNVGGNASYTEQVTFNQITGASATNTITINGNGYLLTFSANSSAPHTLLLDGTDYLYVNNLNIEGTDPYDNITCILTNDASHNVFTSCSFSCAANTTNYGTAAFAISDAPDYVTGGNGGSYNVITGCTIFSGYYGIFAEGTTNGATSMYNVFTSCHITDWYQYMAAVYSSNNMSIIGCTIDRLTRTNNASYSTMLDGYQAVGFNFSNNIVEKVFNATPSLSGAFYCVNSLGSYNYSYSSGNNPCKAINNIFRDFDYEGDIYVFTDIYSTDTRIWHNTISLDQTSSSSSNDAHAFNYIYGGNGVNPSVKNNIVTITRGGTGSKVGFYNGGNSLSGAIVDYNDYYINGVGGNNYIGYVTSQVNSLAAWQLQGADAHGAALDPLYTNPLGGNYHPTNASLNNLGVPLNVGVDNTFAPRSQLTPDMGALEFLSSNCTSTPTNLSVYTPTSPLCPGKNADIYVNGYTSDLGVTYQWLTSTTSSVGPWTLISGANSVLFTTPNLNSTTYYGVAVSCTLVGTTATVANVINIAGTTTSVIPVHEGFEGIVNPTDLPNCSWFALNQGSSAKTYTATTTQNRSAHTGNKYAAFSTSYVNGTNDFYTNGIQLVAGITYSASVWYKTDFNGYTNVSDFSLKYGTSQTQTGLTTIATTGGPASTGIYTALANTFVVATSGIYYVAVEVTSDGNYGSNYLTWDDLDIIIPCSLNTTSVTVSTSTNIVCSGNGVDLTATGADTYMWSTGVTGSITTEFPTQGGMYSVVATNTLSSCSQTISTAFITVLPSPNLFVVANKPQVCVGDQVSLTAIGAPNFLWTNNNAITSVVTFTPTQNTTYTVSGTNSVGCTTVAQYSVVVIANPTITVSSNAELQNQICKGDNVTLTGVGALSFTWTSPSIYLQSNIAVVSPISSTNYTVTGTGANGCVGKTFYALNVDDCTGLNKIAAVGGLKLYPNPTESSFVIETTSTSVKTIEVIDVTGRVILTENSSSDKININLSNFSNGVYYVKVQSEKAIQVIKVVKQ